MWILATILIYFAVLMAISCWTSRRATNDTFYRADRKAPWPMVAFGMVGASISGVTFVSVPGMVTATQMTYLQMCLGFIVGYAVVATLLLPLYYRLSLTTIYGYLGRRLGDRSYRTGAWFFLLSKMAGAVVKFYVVAMLLQQFVFDAFGVPFVVTVAVLVLLIWLYSRRGGIGTLVFTDTFQTVCLLTALLLIIYKVVTQLQLSLAEAVSAVARSPLSRVFVFDDWASPQLFWKQLLSGAFVVIVMTGLDQDMMQKNLTCKTLGEAQKDMLSYGVAFVPVNLLFLALGVLLTMVYGATTDGVTAIPAGDHLLLDYVQSAGGSGFSVLPLLFVLGVVAASFSTADSALTSMTTSYCVDIRRRPADERLRKRTHLVMCLLFVILIVLFRLVNSTSLLDAVYTLVSYTYGPLLGLFAYGLFTRRAVNDRFVPYICIASPLVCYGLQLVFQTAFAYHFGYELLIVNGALTFLGLRLTAKTEDNGEW